MKNKKTFFEKHGFESNEALRQEAWELMKKLDPKAYEEYINNPPKEEEFDDFSFESNEALRQEAQALLEMLDPSYKKKKINELKNTIQAKRSKYEKHNTTKTKRP